MKKNFLSHRDPSQNYLELTSQSLDAVFYPKSIAVIGASETSGSVGRTLMLNLLQASFPGEIYPVNPNRKEVFGLACYSNVTAIEKQEIDLAVIITPAPTVLKIIRDCAAKKIKAAIIISAGFKEMGPEGEKLEQEIIEVSRKNNLRIVGPNCLGVMNTHSQLNATFAAAMAKKGNIAFISQSGAMCTAVLDWSLKEELGFSAFVSIGSMDDVDFGDIIDYLGNDPHTESILIYMETIGNPRRFLSAARKVSHYKPIIIIKVGRTEAAAKAAASHTGSMAGSDAIFDACIFRSGALRVNSISELFDMALVLAKQPLPKGPNLCLITNAGGPAVLATDAVISQGASMAKLSETTIDSLNEFLPAAWSHGNPVDILGDANAERYEKTIEIVSKDPSIDGILTILSPQDMTDPVGTAEAIKKYADLKTKPILASWMGGKTVQEGAEALNKAGIPTFGYPDDAAKAFAYMWTHRLNLNALYQTPAVRDEVSDPKACSAKHLEASKIIHKTLQEKRTLLTEEESKRALKAYDIPIVETKIAADADEAVKIAASMGFPVVLKIHSETITHKSDIGGVKLNIQTEEGVHKAFQEIKQAAIKHKGIEHFQGVSIQRMVQKQGFELILGTSVDPQFGPVILFGTGGKYVEVYKDQALALPPINSTLAKRMMNRTKIYEALKGVRGEKTINLVKLEEILVSFSRFILENPRIAECDINPLLASPEEIIALDARIVLHEADIADKDLPKPSIRPYPIHWVQSWKLQNGQEITIRPIRPEDEPMIKEFHARLSEETIQERYFAPFSLEERTQHERLIQVCSDDYDRNIVLIAETMEKKIIGIVRLSKIDFSKAQFKITVADDFQNLGLGTKFMETLITIAKEEHIPEIIGLVSPENKKLIHICQKLKFEIQPYEYQPSLRKMVFKL